MAESEQSASISGNDNIIIQANCSGVNVQIGTGRPHIRLTQYQALIQRALKQSFDSTLLSPYRSDVVELVGRDSAVDGLQRWLGDDAIISVRVLVGRGGRGKTRLALELALKASKEGWLSGFVTQQELDRFCRDQNIAEWGWDTKTLIVVDDAAGRAEQLRVWLRELVDTSSTKDRPRLRILLLERQAQRATGSRNPR